MEVSRCRWLADAQRDAPGEGLRGACGLCSFSGRVHAPWRHVVVLGEVAGVEGEQQVLAGLERGEGVGTGGVGVSDFVEL